MLNNYIIMKAEIYKKTKDYAVIRWSESKLGFGELTIKWDYNTSRYILDSEMLGLNETIKIFKALK